MTLALTKVQAFAVERDEPLTKKFMQFLRLKGTAANTDATYDLSAYTAGALGTFWDAVDGSTVGAKGLACIRSIGAVAEVFNGVTGLGLNGKVQVDAARDLITKIDSAVSVGGNATEAMTVTGLLTTDTILGVTQFVDGDGAAVGILSYGTAGVAAANNALSVTWNADPGAGAKIRVIVKRAGGTTTPEAGTYQLAMGSTNTKVPDITFLSGDAPTAFDLLLMWQLPDGCKPIQLDS